MSRPNYVLGPSPLPGTRSIAGYRAAGQGDTQCRRAAGGVWLRLMEPGQVRIGVVWFYGHWDSWEKAESADSELDLS